ncbi:unnamed protein product [marine sediment metagenome]|uniref:Uncharacterized protein n=1 Tax=marine sediment metagenome TaxID=412755 RepID=X0SMF2_9ZZZZ
MPEFKHLLKTEKQRLDWEREVEKARLELQKKKEVKNVAT